MTGRVLVRLGNNASPPFPQVERSRCSCRSVHAGETHLLVHRCEVPSAARGVLASHASQQQRNCLCHVPSVRVSGSMNRGRDGRKVRCRVPSAEGPLSRPDSPLKHPVAKRGRKNRWIDKAAGVDNHGQLLFLLALRRC